ncbi:MAG TPA: hypothetical protein VGL03_12025 [Thermoanaerobaculia bacterium]|jgi:hypothetical protein
MRAQLSTARTFDWLFRALDAGIEEIGTLPSDNDLDALRGDPRYRNAIDVARALEKESEKDDLVLAASVLAVAMRRRTVV